MSSRVIYYEGKKKTPSIMLFIFASQGFFIRTASHEHLTYRAIKSRDCFSSRNYLAYLLISQMTKDAALLTALV